MFTSPTPPSLGLVDVSVLVQDEATHQLAPRDIIVTVESQHVATGAVVRNQATAANATNRLLQSAPCRWNAAGRWHIIVCISDPFAESQRVDFDVTVNSGRPSSSRIGVLDRLARCANRPVHYASMFSASEGGGVVRLERSATDEGVGFFATNAATTVDK